SQRNLLTSAVSGLDNSIVDADFFSTFRIHAEACVRLAADFVFGLGRFDYVVSSHGLLLSANVHLTAVNDDVHIGFLPVVGAGVVAHDDRAIGTNDQG